jgi:PPIC-type peptidyl-prolyl cis-trans isomerase-like protein
LTAGAEEPVVTALERIIPHAAMVWYVPPLCPIQSHANSGAIETVGEIPDVRSLRIPVLRELDRFESVARELSNCPSDQHGGNLGQLGRGETVPEFEQALFKLGPTGLLRELVKTRYGFHIVAVDRRIPGRTVPFEAVQESIVERLKTMVEEKALRQYVSVLAGRAEIEGVDLDAAVTPLVQ